MKLNRTPSLHDRQWRNEENENWQDIEKALSTVLNLDEVAQEYINILTRLGNSRVETIRYDFEIGTISSYNNGEKLSNAKRLRTGERFPLQSGDLVNPTSNEDYEYSLMLEQDGEWLGGWGLGWFPFGTSYEVPEDYRAHVVVRHTGTERDMSQDDIDAVERDFKVNKRVAFDNTVKITPEFEYGGWWHPSGNKTTGTGPYSQVRSVAPYEVTPGMTINPKANENYVYKLLLFKDGESLDWTELFNFGEPYTFEDSYEVRISIEKKDGSNMSATDLAAIANDFGSIEMNLEKYLKALGVEMNTIVHFEYGGWLYYSSGNINKVTGDNPFQIRNTEPVKVSPGMTIHPAENSTYIYRILLYKDENTHGWIDENFSFGEVYTFDDFYEVRLTIERRDQATMTGDDLSAISKLFGSIKPSATGAPTRKAIDDFNIVGQMGSVLTGEITDHFSSPMTISSQAVHDRFIDLVDNNTDVADYKNLGTDGYGYNIYRYDSFPNILKDGGEEWLQPPRGSEGRELNPPKIILTSSIHGRERSASYVLYYFMMNLLNNPTNNPVFDTLRDNIHFKFYPICSPSGFNDNTYENRAGVNVNRDFPPHGAVTQKESQIIKAELDANSDADYHIDFHNFKPWSYNNDLFGYALTDDKDLKRLTTNTYKFVGREWQKQHTNLPQNRRYMWGYTADANIGTVAKYSNDVLGIPGTIIETPWYMNLFDETEGNMHSALVTQLGVDLLANLIISIVEARK